MIVRDMIKEAATRAGIVPRRQPVPGAIQETALQLLHAAVSTYNNDDFLSWTENTVDLPGKPLIHIYDQVDTFAGEFNRYFKTVEEMNSPLNIPTADDVENGVYAVVMSNPTVFYRAADAMPAPVWETVELDEFDPRRQQMEKYCRAYHINLKHVSKIKSLMLKNNVNQSFELHFEPHSKFDSFLMNEPVWTFVERGQGEWIVKVKPYVVNTANRLTMDYNRAVEFDIDTDMRVPDVYVELLIATLTLKLAKKFPRLDDAHIQRLEDDVTDLINNVRTPKADAKLILRDADTSTNRHSYYGVITGRCLF